MNNEIYKRIKTELLNVNFKFIEPQKAGLVEVSVNDKIKISEILDDEIELLLTRTIILDKTSMCLSVDFAVSILTSKKVIKEELVADLKKGIPILSIAYSKISMLIADITNASPMGAFITSPNCDKNFELID